MKEALFHIVPPNDVKTEKQVIGSILTFPELFVEVFSIIPTEEVFYNDLNKKVFRACIDIQMRGGKVDTILVANEIGMDRVQEVMELVTSCSMVDARNTSEYCTILMNLYMLRNIITLGIDMVSKAKEPLADASELQEHFVVGLYKAFEGKSKSNWIKLNAVAVKFMQEIEDKRAGKTIAIPTTYSDIDRLNGGLKNGDSVVVGARPGMGKSAFVLPPISYCARNIGAVGIINLEMKDTQTFGRMVSQNSNIPFKDIDNGRNVGDSKLIDIVGSMSSLPIFFNTGYDMTIGEIVAAATWLKERHNLALLVIDYLQLIKTSNSKNREQEVSTISRTIKTLALSLKIPIIVLSQLNRGLESRASKKPQLSDLRESGAIEQDADIVLLIHRDFQAGILTDDQGQPTDNNADVGVAKWRNGTTGSVELHFDGPTMRFSDKKQEEFKTMEPPAHKIFRKPYKDSDEDQPF